MDALRVIEESSSNAEEMQKNMGVVDECEKPSTITFCMIIHSPFERIWRRVLQGCGYLRLRKEKCARDDKCNSKRLDEQLLRCSCCCNAQTIVLLKFSLLIFGQSSGQ